jgi:hypothetical protein
MLRLFVLLLLLANGVYFAWSQGYLSSLGLLPYTPGEAERLNRQIKPEAIRLLGSAEARRAEPSVTSAATSPASADTAPAPTSSPTTTTASTQPPAPTQCLQTGLLSDAQIKAVRSAAAALPEGSWRLEEGTEGGRWIVYMGKYKDNAEVNKKKAELRQLNVSFEGLRVRSLEPGISLGGFATEAEAEKAQAEFSARGVRSAKVAQEFAGRKGQMLKLPTVDEALRPQIDALRSAAGGKDWQAC